MKVTRAHEDYLECILILEKEDMKVKSIDISKKLNVSKAAVSKIMIELLEQEMIHKDYYGKIELTEKGRTIANETYKKHILLKNFLLNLGVSEENAEHDCCLIEHIVSDETINKIKEYLKNEN